MLAERYFGSVGVVSAGVFRKDVVDFAYTESTTIASGEVAGFELRQPRNGARSPVRVYCCRRTCRRMVPPSTLWRLTETFRHYTDTR